MTKMTAINSTFLRSSAVIALMIATKATETQPSLFCNSPTSSTFVLRNTLHFQTLSSLAPHPEHGFSPGTSRSHQHGGGGVSSWFDQHFLGFLPSRANFSRKCCRRGGGGVKKIFRTNISIVKKHFPDYHKHIQNLARMRSKVCFICVIDCPPEI